MLEDILNSRNIECTQDELTAVYAGMKDLNCNTTLTQFNRELDAQINKISFARNKSTLLETWRLITGEDSIKTWCNTHDVPLMWIVPKELTKAFSTLLDVQNGNYTVDAAVTSAIHSLQKMDTSILTDNSRIEKAFMALIGSEYSLLWDVNRVAIITEAKIKIGNDMSTWTAADLTTLQCRLSMDIKQIKIDMLHAVNVEICEIEHSITEEYSSGSNMYTEVGASLISKAGGNSTTATAHSETIKTKYSTVNIDTVETREISIV